MQINPVVFREYDIRGVYEKDFDLTFAELLGRAIVTYFSIRQNNTQPNITTGHDARLSSPAIVAALSRGVRSSGGNVVLIGLVTTPVSYFTTFECPGVDGAIMVTGSHNPPEYNGFKISIGRSTIFGKDIQFLAEIIAKGHFVSGSGNESSLDVFPRYISRYAEEFRGLKSIPVVLDCGNGAAGIVARRLYEAVGLTPHILFEEPDGRFPNHHPDPTVEENLQGLANAVCSIGAAVGIGFDGDADRIGVVDSTGKMLFGDELIALCARFVLQEHPQQKIIGDVKCSDRLYDYIEKYGGTPIMWKTGHSLIKEKIKVEHSPFGGELSGHVFFADRNYGFDDSLYAGLRVVEIISKTGLSLRELLSDFPPAFNTPEIRIDTTEEKKHLVIERLKSYFSAQAPKREINLIDGIRVSYPDGWALARASNTQPVLVLRYESSTSEGLARIRKEFESVVSPLL